jgi:predicted regulator of Ras-like GTPase activity (Roadblock/LC7/MglB family)
MANLMEILNAVSQEVPGCIMTSVVSHETGLPLASVSVSSVNPEDAAGADAFHSQLYRQIRAAVAELGTDQPVEAVVISADHATFVSWPLGDDFFWHVVTSPETTLGFTRAIMRKVSGEVQEGVSDLLDT